MRVALATCARLPSHEFDDRTLEAAFRERGAEAEGVAWDDPAVDWGSYDGCLIRTTWDYAERLEDFVAWAERVSDEIPFFNGPDVVRWNLHKSYLGELAEQGVPVVDTLRFDADAAGLAAARAHLEGLLPTRAFLLQPYHASVETFGELSAVFVEGELTHCVRKVPVPGDYRVQDEHGGSDELFEPTPLEAEMARAAVAAAAARGHDLLYARVDWLRDGREEPRLVELELVEPSLFFRHSSSAAERLADAFLGRLG